MRARHPVRWWLALCCAAVGVWLLGIGIIYTDWPAIALATAAIVLGVAGVTRRRPPG